MASTGLTKGAFPRADIDEYVPQGETAGVYVIGWINEQGVFCVGYVGRSDHNDGGLNARLHDHDAKWPSWTHFKFDYFDAKAAFERESRIWHDFQLSKRGQIHPPRPKDKTYPCPMSGECFPDAKSQKKR